MQNPTSKSSEKSAKQRENRKVEKSLEIPEKIW